MAQPLGNRLPGIVVTITADAGLIAPFGFERFPCIIGKGDIEIPKERDLVVPHPSAGGIDSLQDNAQTIFRIGDAPGITTYTEITDYIHTPGTSAIDWSPSGAEPKVGKNFYVSYTVEMSSSAFEPILYLDEDLLLQERGRESIFSDIDLRNDLVTAARLAFKNGATGVIVSQLDFQGDTTLIPESSAWNDPLDPTGDEMSTSYDLAEMRVDKIEEFKLWLVPLDPSSLPTVLDPHGEKTFPAGEDNNSRWYLHAIHASDAKEGRERTVFGVVPQGTRLSGGPFPILTDVAKAFRETGGGDRMIITGAKGRTDIEASAVAVSIFTRTGDITPVSFLNAATAGLFSGRRIGAPNNSAPLAGVAVLDDWTIPEARVLRGGGVIPYKVRANLTRMIIPISTDTTSAFTEDLSVQDIADYLRGFIRLRLFDAFSNVNITADTEGSLIAALSSLLEGLIKDRILVAFTDIQATQRTDEPRKIDMRGKVKPAFPLRWIDVDLVFTANIS